jgi:hypothetical protein
VTTTAEKVWSFVIWAGIAAAALLYWHSTVPPTPRPIRTPEVQQSGYNGYTVRCADGWISHSGGIQGACSHHGGESP